MKNTVKIYFLITLIIIGCLFNGIDSYAGSSATQIAGNTASSTDAAIVPSDAPSINAQAAIVMDVDTGDILYEKNAHEQLYPASITKVMTCLLAVENGNVNDELTVSDSVMSQVEDGSSAIGLQSGEKLTLKSALYGMMLNSGNECALTIAEYIGGSTEGFADMMNQRAKELGCLDSHFVNPNGLQNSDHYTSCYDMALIGKAAYQYPEFKKLISSQSYTIPETNMNEERPLWQENRLTYSGNGEYYYEYCTGGKTGYTETALATLISFAERDGRRLVTVVMRCNPTTESYLDTIKLDDFCFNNYNLYKPLTNFDFRSVNDENLNVLSNYYDDLNHELPKYYVNRNYSFYIRSFVNESDVLQTVNFYVEPQNGIAGQIIFTYNGVEIGRTDITINLPPVIASSTDAIIAQNNTPKPESKVLKWAKRIIVILIALILLLIFLIVFIKIRKKIQMYNSKRTIKYFPRSRDPRLRAKEEEAKEKEKKDKENTDKLKDIDKEVVKKKKKDLDTEIPRKKKKKNIDKKVDRDIDKDLDQKKDQNQEEK